MKIAQWKKGIQVAIATVLVVIITLLGARRTWYLVQELTFPWTEHTQAELDVKAFAQQHGLTGLEFAHGIPGSVGGAVCRNAGAYGGEMRQVVHSAVVLFPEEGIRTLTGEELAFSYRHSLLTDRPDAVVLRAVFTLEPGEPAAIREKMDDLMARRKASQPLEYPSAGSTFKRPEGYYAAALIDQCGLKGLTVGGAQVSEKHAGFVINRGGASCADVTALMTEIQKRVWEETGVRLEPEVKVIH